MHVPLSRYRDLLARYLGPQRRRVVVMAVLLLLSIAAQLVRPQLLRSFIDLATGGAAVERLVALAVIFIVTAILTQVVAVALVYISEQVGWTATNALREDLALHCLRLDMPFHNTRTPGELIERVDGDVNALSAFFAQFVVRILGNGLLLLGVLVALGTLIYLRNLAVEANTHEREAYAQHFGYIEERLAAIPDIRANGAGPWTMRGLTGSMQDVYRRAAESQRKNTRIWTTTIALFGLGYVVALGMGAYLYQRGTVSLGTVYLIFQYTTMLRQPLEQITQQMRELQRAAAGIVRVGELFAVESAVADGRGDALPAGPLSVEFEHVTFGYGEEPVLRDISLCLRPGAVLGVLGRTGSGKTTLGRLLFRLYEPQAGRLCLGGVDIRHVYLDELRSRVGIVTQDVQVFEATLRDNLTLFDRTVPDERILAVLADLGLSPWYATLPDGLETGIGAGGVSAGEAQLIAFARVFLEDPGVVILDEASSRLDPLTERLIERAVDRLLAGRTGIIIAHRLATLERADQILVLEDGRAVEQGVRAALVADPASRYARLLHTAQEVPA